MSLRNGVYPENAAPTSMKSLHVSEVDLVHRRCMLAAFLYPLQVGVQVPQKEGEGACRGPSRAAVISCCASPSLFDGGRYQLITNQCFSRFVLRSKEITSGRTFPSFSFWKEEFSPDRTSDTASVVSCFSLCYFPLHARHRYYSF